MNVLLARPTCPTSSSRRWRTPTRSSPHRRLAGHRRQRRDHPDAREKADSPIYGMPILNVDESNSVIVLKRSMNSRFAGIDKPALLQREDGDALRGRQDLGERDHRGTQSFVELSASPGRFREPKLRKAAAPWGQGVRPRIRGPCSPSRPTPPPGSPVPSAASRSAATPTGSSSRRLHRRPAPADLSTTSPASSPTPARASPTSSPGWPPRRTPASSPRGLRARRRRPPHRRPPVRPQHGGPRRASRPPHRPPAPRRRLTLDRGGIMGAWRISRRCSPLPSRPRCWS